MDGASHQYPRPAGETSKTINLPMGADMNDEPAKTFTITLRNPTGAPLGTSSVATVTIHGVPALRLYLPLVQHGIEAGSG